MLDHLNQIPHQFFSSDRKSLSPLSYVFLVLLCLAFFVPGLVTMPATDRDEASFAQASKQMIESSNYTDIRVQNVPRYKKPIGIYWLQAAAVQTFSRAHLNEIWAYRIPSFVGATVAVVTTAALGTLLFAPSVGLVGAIMLAGSVLLNVEARLAKTDAALLASIMIAMYMLAKTYVHSTVLTNPKATGHGGAKQSIWIALAFWTAIAAGILIKGPIIFLPVGATLLWLRVSDKSIAWFSQLRPLLGTFYALALVSPWFIEISLQSHGVFMEQSAGHDMFAKILHGQDRGIMPPGLHLMALPLAFFPFALFILFAMPDAWKNRHDRSIKFCLGWIIPTWIVFEMSLTKLPHYVLPTYPAIALLTAKFLIDGFPSLSATTRRFPLALTIGFWLMIGMGFAIVFSLLPVFVDQVWQWPQILAGAAIIIAQATSLVLLPKRKIASFVVLTTGALLFTAITFGATIPNLQHIWITREIVDTVETVKPCAHSQIVAEGYHEPSLVFLGGTDTVLAMSGAEAADDLRQDPCRVVVVDKKHTEDFLGAFRANSIQPTIAGTITGLNSGHGAETALTAYVLHP